MAEFDFFIEHRPGVTNIVPGALSCQSILDLPIVEDSCSPEEGATSFLVLALSADVPHHTPSLVSETLNGTFAHLHHICLLTHTTVHPTASKLIEPETTKVDPFETSSKSDYLQALPGLNLHRSQFAEQQQKDYWCSLTFKVHLTPIFFFSLKRIHSFFEAFW